MNKWMNKHICIHAHAYLWFCAPLRNIITCRPSLAVALRLAVSSCGATSRGAQRSDSIGISGVPKMGVPEDGWFRVEILLKWMMTGGTPIFGTLPLSWNLTRLNWDLLLLNGMFMTSQGDLGWSRVWSWTWHNFFQPKRVFPSPAVWGPSQGVVMRGNCDHRFIAFVCLALIFVAALIPESFFDSLSLCLDMFLQVWKIHETTMWAFCKESMARGSTCRFPEMGVPQSSSILDWDFSWNKRTNHPSGGSSIYGSTHLVIIVIW